MPTLSFTRFTQAVIACTVRYEVWNKKVNTTTFLMFHFQNVTKATLPNFHNLQVIKIQRFGQHYHEILQKASAQNIFKENIMGILCGVVLLHIILYHSRFLN